MSDNKKFILFFIVPIVALVIWGITSANSIDKEQPVAEHSCNDKMNTKYLSPYDDKYYEYTCNDATGIWEYSDKYSDPSCKLIKGNIAFETREKIYHVKGQAYYDDTEIALEYGERYFCSEQEAIEAGWRKSYE